MHLYVSLWFFFFKQKTAYEMRISDWSSDVCSSDLEARDPRRLRLGMDRLHPVERRGGVAQFADAIVERALAAADAAEVEAQHRETARDEAFVHRLRDSVVHRAAALRIRVEDQRDQIGRAHVYTAVTNAHSV